MNRAKATRRGGALVMVMLIVCVLSVVAASMLLVTTTRYHTTYQSASWQEAIVGAEAGVDLAMTELRKRVVNGPRSAFKTGAKDDDSGPAPAVYWTMTKPNGKKYEDFGHACPANHQPYIFSASDGSIGATHGGEGNTAMQVRVFVDVPGSDTIPAPTNFALDPDNGNNSFISQLDNPGLRDPDGVNRTRWWYRIRSLGIAGVSGPRRPNLDKLDNRLRRFSFLNDWRTGDPVSSPQVARMVEVLVRPEMNFRNALMADKQIDLSHEDVLIDSYDSGKGYYDSKTNHGTMGNIATNGKLINANNASVQGNAMTNNGTVKDSGNVTGQQSTSFYQELTPYTAGLLNPAWSGVKDGGTLRTNTTYVASTDSTNPTLVRLDAIDLPAASQTVNITAPDGTAADTPAYLKLYVQGDVKTAGNSSINVAANVNLIIYVTGNVSLQGNGIINNSYMARNLMINGVQPPKNKDGTTPARTINIATQQDFEGIIYAPNHDLTLALTAALPGGLLTPVLQPVVDPKTQHEIDKLQKDIDKNNADINKKQNEYDNLIADYNRNGTKKSYDDAQKKKKEISDLQAKNSTLQAQIDNLKGKSPASSDEDHARGYNGIYGGFIANTITVASKTHIHYDETLRNAGPVNHYEIVNWFEDSISRAATGGSNAFWWSPAK